MCRKAKMLTRKEVVLDCASFRYGQGVSGYTAKVLASKPGIAELHIKTEENNVALQSVASKPNKVIGELTYDPAQLKRKGEYLVLRLECYNDPQTAVQYHLPYQAAFHNHRFLAGVCPAWVNFPLEWGAWIRNEHVKTSAYNYIFARAPQTIPMIWCWLSMVEAGQESLLSSYSEWLYVAELCLPKQAVDALTNKTAGRGLSQLSVEAMPIRIAQKLGGWIPPIPHPTYAPMPDSLATISPKHKVYEPMVPWQPSVYEGFGDDEPEHCEEDWPDELFEDVHSQPVAQVNDRMEATVRVKANQTRPGVEFSGTANVCIPSRSIKREFGFTVIEPQGIGKLTFTKDGQNYLELCCNDTAAVEALKTSDPVRYAVAVVLSNATSEAVMSLISLDQGTMARVQALIAMAVPGSTAGNSFNETYTSEFSDPEEFNVFCRGCE